MGCIMYRNNRSYRNKLAEKRVLESRELQRRVARLEKLMYEKGFKNIYDDDFWDKIADSEEINETPTSGPVSDEESEDKHGGAVAEVFENVICHAIQCKGIMPEDYDQVYVNAIIKSCIAKPKKGEKAPTGDAKRKIAESVFYNIYDSLRDTVLDGVKLKTLNGKQTVSKAWQALGFYSRYGATPSGVPKTDVISGSGDIHVSIKKKGGSQLMSGTVCETLATINAAALKISNDISAQLIELEEQFDSIVKEGKENSDDYNALVKKYNALQDKYNDALSTIDRNVDTVDDIISAGGKFGNQIKGNVKNARKAYNQQLEAERQLHGLQDQIEELDEINDDLKSEFGQLEMARKTFERDVISQIKSPSSELHYEILRESITGETKFKNGAGTANYVLVWDTSGKCEVYSIDEYIQHISGHYKFDLSYKTNSVKLKGRKTGKYRADIALRITVNS